MKKALPLLILLIVLILGWILGRDYMQENQGGSQVDLSKEYAINDKEMDQLKSWYKQAQQELSTTKPRKKYYSKLEGHWKELGKMLGEQDQQEPKEIAPETAKEQKVATKRPLKKEDSVSPQSTPKAEDQTEYSQAPDLSREATLPFSVGALFKTSFSYLPEALTPNQSEVEKNRSLNKVRAENFFEHLKYVQPFTEARFQRVLGHYKGKSYLDAIDADNLNAELLFKKEGDQYRYEFKQFDDQNKQNTNSTGTISKNRLGERSSLRKYDQNGYNTIVIQYGGNDQFLHLFINPNDSDDLSGIIYQRVASDFVEAIGSIILTKQ